MIPDEKTLHSTREALTNATADLCHYIERHNGGAELFEALKNILKASVAFEEWTSPGEFKGDEYTEETLASVEEFVRKEESP